VFADEQAARGRFVLALRGRGRLNDDADADHRGRFSRDAVRPPLSVRFHSWFYG